MICRILVCNPLLVPIAAPMVVREGGVLGLRLSFFQTFAEAR